MLLPGWDLALLFVSCQGLTPPGFLACGNSLANWESQHLPKLAGVANLSITIIDQGFTRRLVDLLERNISWDITITEGTIYLQLAGETLETRLLHS